MQREGPGLCYVVDGLLESTLPKGGFFFIWTVVSACLHPGGCIGPSVGSALSKLHGDTAQAAGPGREGRSPQGVQ